MSAFQSTLWTVIRGAREGDESHLGSFVERYRPPVVKYIARRGIGDEAEDLAQEVFVKIFTQGILEKADPAKGRFRSLLLAVTRHAIGHHLEKRGAQKRGGGKVAALGDIDVAAPEEDEAFDREWVTHLVEMSLSRLAREHPHYHEALGRALFEKQSYAEVAEALERTENQVRNHVHRGRAKLVQYIRDEIHEYATSDEDFQEEIQSLARYFPAQRG